MSGQLSIFESSAYTSPDGRYRYELTRRWDDRPLLGWVMLNPSTADGNSDDPTIRRCIRFAVDNQFGGIIVRNLFAFRATHPDALLRAHEPFGFDNLVHLSECRAQPLTIAAWGAHPAADRILYLAAEALAECKLACLGTTKGGRPRHPLYVPAAQPFLPFELVA